MTTPPLHTQPECPGQLEKPSQVSADDRELMLRISRGDQGSLRELLERYWGPLVRYAIRYLGDSDAAEDAVQEAYVRVWERRAVWKATGNPRSYLYRIVRNLVLQDLEKRSVRTRWREAQQTEAHFGLSPTEVFEANALRRSLEEAIQALPPRRQEVLILARFHDLSHQQIAEVMDISPQTVANQMSSALRELREVLRKYQDEGGQ